MTQTEIEAKILDWGKTTGVQGPRVIGLTSTEEKRDLGPAALNLSEVNAALDDRRDRKRVKKVIR